MSALPTQSLFRLLLRFALPIFSHLQLFLAVWQRWTSESAARMFVRLVKIIVIACVGIRLSDIVNSSLVEQALVLIIAL